MKQRRSRGLFEKAENASVRNTPAQRGKHTLPEGAFRKWFEGKEKEADGGVPPVRFKCSNGAAEFAGAREPRWSPAAIHGEAGGSEGTSVLRAPFRVDWWWWWLPVSTTSTASFAPADGGSGGRGARRRGLQRLN